MSVFIATGRQTVLLAKKGSTYLIAGCATQVGWSQSAQTKIRNCRDGRTKDYDEYIDHKATVSGIRRVATSTDAAANVTIDDWKGWQNAKTKVEFKVGIYDFTTSALVVGSFVEAGKGIINEVSFDGPETGDSTYSVSIDVDDADFTSTAVVAP